MGSFVYSCGSNGKYQLGNGTDTDLNELERVFATEFGVEKISCGGNHTLLLLDNGDLYSTGDNSHGQCAVAGEPVIPHFTQIKKVNASKWINCSAGFEFSVLVNEDNEVYTCGLGPKGELGLGYAVKKSPELQKIEFNSKSKVVDVKSCLDHTVILLENHELYGFGNGRNGKIGEPAEKQIWTPRLIDLEFSVSHVDIGRDFTAVSDGRVIRLLGNDKFNILQSIPKEFRDFKTMWSSLHLITPQDTIISLGNNSHGQIMPHTDTQFDLFEVGSEHGLITNHNVLFSWGWGEHGNCGINKEESVTFDYINELFRPPSGETIVLIKGGCATTWAVTTRDV